MILRGLRCCFAQLVHFSSNRAVERVAVMAINVGDMRRPYRAVHDVLLEKDVANDPFLVFSEWFARAKEAQAAYETNAMALATASRDGRPSVRMVLLKGYGADGFVFFTNYESRKGQNLAENPHAALLFYWDQLHRQVRVEGKVERISEQDSDEYFKSRPKPSQCAATASAQSQTVPSRDYLDDVFDSIMKKNEDRDALGRPSYWGGLRLIPTYFEFWQGQTTRLHDRLVFERPDPSSTSWSMRRLAP